MDIQKIVNDKVNSILESGEIEKNIEESIEKSILSSIKSKFTGYSFERDIEEKLSDQIDPILKSIDLSSYASLVRTRYEEIIKSVMDKSLSDQVTKIYNKIFDSNSEPLKVSKILESAKECFRDECEPCQEPFLLEIECNENDYGGISYDIMFQKEKDDSISYSSYRKTRENKIHLYKAGVNDDSEFKVISATIDGTNFSSRSEGIRKLSRMSDYESLILNAFLSERSIEVDVEHEDDFDTHYNEFH